MDDGLDMDELFGEGASLAPPLMPAPKGLVQRIEEQRSSGCCRKLAWSNLGCIASVSEDDLGISVRSLYCRPEDGDWSLSDAFPIHQVQAIHESQPLAHISWNQAGSELAVVDVLGRLSIFSIFIAINRLISSRSGLVDQPDDLGAIVGLKWLSQDRPYATYRPAVNRGAGYEYAMLQKKLLGPFHPHQSRSALVCVTRGGVVRLVYQAPDSAWLEARTELENISSSDNVLSHGSMCSDQDNTILLIVRTISYEFRLYRLGINWNAQPDPKAALAPVIEVHHLKISFPPLHSNMLSSLEGGDVEVASSELTHLEMVPVSPQTETSPQAPPTILAVYSRLPRPDDPDAEGPSTTILRYELVSEPQRLHSSFDQLASKKKGTSSADERALDLRQRESLSISKTILFLQTNPADESYLLAYSDGSVEFRHGRSMEIIAFNNDFKTVAGLPHVGFGMPPDEPCLHLAVSPNFCLAVALNPNGQVRLKRAQYMLGEPGDSPDDAKFASIICGCALQFVYSCTHHNNNDDLSALVRQLEIPNLEGEFLNEIFRAMSMSVDYSLDSQYEKLFRNPMIQRCLSMQNSLSFKGERKHRNLNAKLAWFTLHLRLVALTFAFSFNNGRTPNEKNNSETEFAKPEVLRTLLGVVRYFIDFTNLLVDELFELANFLRNQKLTLTLLQDHLTNTNALALPLLLSSVPRALIRYNSRGVRVLRHTLVTMFEPSNAARAAMLNDPSVVSSVSMLVNIVEKSPVKTTEFERFLNEVDDAIKDAYRTSEITDAGRRQAEKTLLISATIPPQLLPAVGKTLGPLLGGLRSAINPAELYFSDYSWLGMSDDRRTDEWARTNTVDAIRKISLSKATPLRQCTRCCAKMEDVKPQKGTSFWMTSLQKMCLCGSLWMLLDQSEKV
ncbi:MAG: mediator complex subunit [Chaenotheca gracillima]|nr:MAG: mediator complex subunit [Chaenotheca gracillima]